MTFIVAYENLRTHHKGYLLHILFSAAAILCGIVADKGMMLGYELIKMRILQIL